MRARIYAVVVAIILGLVFGFTGRATDLEVFNTFAGLAWLVAIVLGISLLPFWSKVIPTVEPMQGLFQRPAEGERWCVECGSTTARLAACHVCGAEAKLPKKKPPKPKARPPKARRRSRRRRRSRKASDQRLPAIGLWKPRSRAASFFAMMAR